MSGAARKLQPAPVELENHYGEPVVLSGCKACGDTGVIDHDIGTAGDALAVGVCCSGCVKGLLECATDHARGLGGTIASHLPESVALYLKGLGVLK